GRVYFLGKIFKNSNTARLTDASTTKNSKYAGTIIFQQPNPVYGYMGQQIVEGGYVDTLSGGPSFSSITINNPDGIWLTSDINVLDAVNFQQGHVFLNKYVAALGDSIDFGGVNGFSPERFFVTGTGTTGGALKISSLASCCIVTYPVGVTPGHYTPLQMRNTGTKKAFYARAFSNVYSNAVTGPVLKDTTLTITWSLTSDKPGVTDVEVLLQNDQDVETKTFNEYRDKSYISVYRNNTWERWNTFATPQTPGTITSGAAVYTALMHFRKLSISNKPMFITKRVLPTRVKYQVTNAFSPNGDGINDRWNLPFLDQFATCRVQIFNRQGQLVFTSVGYSTPWDGTIAGRTAPVGTYYYIIDLRNGERPLTGSITILR
ncbi:MAG TPA: gliding motility-associated C-terminal domain-containing protein, partial [Chitinophagaceae bacterium]